MEKLMTRAEYEEILKKENKAKKRKSVPKKKTTKRTGPVGKPAKWGCPKGGAHYWILPVASKTKTTKGKCKKCKKTRRFLNAGPK